MKKNNRTFRLQIELSGEEKQTIEDFWFRERIPSKAEAVRELLRRALAQDREKSNLATIHFKLGHWGNGPGRSAGPGSSERARSATLGICGCIQPTHETPVRGPWLLPSALAAPQKSLVANLRPSVMGCLPS
jgi:hypothetical protein